MPTRATFGFEIADVMSVASLTSVRADDTFSDTSPTMATKPRGCCCSSKDRDGVTVVAGTDIPAHVTAGPYPGGLEFGSRVTDEASVDRVIKVSWWDGELVSDEDKPCSHPGCHRKSRHPKAATDWMLALQPARDRHEQNVEVLAEGARLVLHVIKPIARGQRVLLWYSDSLARAFNVPILTPAHIRGNQQYLCTMCRESFQYPNTLKAHMHFHCPMAPSASSGLSPASSSAHTAISPPMCPSAFTSPLSVFSRTDRSSRDATMTSPESSAFRRRTASVTSPELSTVRRRADENDVKVSVKAEDGGKKHDLRSMTPDSSTDENPALNLSVRRPLCSSLSTSAQASHCQSQQTSPASEKACVGPGAARLGQPIQIFNHIHPPSLPLPLDQHMAALRLYYPWLATLPAPSPAKIICSSVHGQPALLDPQHHYSLHPHGRGFLFPHPHPHPHPHPEPVVLHPSAVKTLQNDNEGLRNVSVQKVHAPTSALAPTSTRNSFDHWGAHIPITTASLETDVASSLPAGSSAVPKSCLPLLPMPTEKEGEPLDLLPPSFFASKSRKGHLCIYCGKIYSRKYGLKIHLRTHTGYKPLKCKVCLRPFGDPSNLNKHVRLHAEGDTPYRCDFCGKVLVRRRDLERHIRSRHPSEAKDADVSSECLDSEPDNNSESESTITCAEEIVVT